MKQRNSGSGQHGAGQRFTRSTCYRSAMPKSLERPLVAACRCDAGIVVMRTLGVQRVTPLINFRMIKSVALANSQLICRRVLPGGRISGQEYVVRNPKRIDRHPGSLKINLRTGLWADFATKDRGGDLISLVAWRYDVRQSEAARQLAIFLHIESEAH